MTAFFRHYEEFTTSELIEEVSALTNQPEENLLDLSWFDLLEMIREHENNLWD